VETEAELEQFALELKLNRDKLSGEKLFVESKVISTQRKTPFEDALVGLKMQLAEGRAAGMNDQHPKVKTLMALMDKYEELAKQEASPQETETERTRNPVYTSIQDSIYQLEVRESVARKTYEHIGANLTRVAAIVDQLPELERRYAQLTRNYESTSDLQKRIFNQFKVTELQLSLEREAAAARYDVITPPRVEYSSPLKRALLLAVLGALAGLASGLAYGAAREIQRHVAQHA